MLRPVHPGAELNRAGAAVLRSLIGFVVAHILRNGACLRDVRDITTPRKCATLLSG